MSPRRVLAVTLRIFTDLRNDPRTVALILVAPIIAMSLFGLAFSGEIRDVRTILVNSDEGFYNPLEDKTVYVSKEITERLDRRSLSIREMKDPAAALKEARDGGASVVILFPASFTRDLVRRRFDPSYKEIHPVKVLLDRSNTTIADAAMKSIASSVDRTITGSKYAVPLTIDTSEAIFARDAKFMDFFVPGIMSFVVYLLTTILTILAFVNEKTTGTLERISATPLTAAEIVTGYCVAFSIVGMAQAGILLSVGILAFGITVAGHIALAFLVIALLAVACQAMGILLSSLASRELQAIQIFPLVAIPGFLLGGVFWPVEAIPAWLRPVSGLLPITYAVDACRAVTLRGWGIEKISRDLMALGTFAIVFITLAMLLLRRRRRG